MMAFSVAERKVLRGEEGKSMMTNHEEMATTQVIEPSIMKIQRQLLVRYVRWMFVSREGMGKCVPFVCSMIRDLNKAVREDIRKRREPGREEEEPGKPLLHFVASVPG